jgi:uncharacterized membrane protein YphA (DoxX/SURF4 family)
MSAIAATIGRILIGLLFVISGINKVLYPAGFAGDLQAVNLPAAGDRASASSRSSLACCSDLV